MGNRKKILGKSLSDILMEEINPDKVLAGSKQRCSVNFDSVKKSLYRKYLNANSKTSSEISTK